MNEESVEPANVPEGPRPESPPSVQESPLSSALAGAESLNFVMDVPLELSVEIGRRTMRLAEVLKLGAGSVLELERTSGEPLCIYANNRLVARGQAVVIGERYGVRLTEVLVVDEGGQP